MTEITAEHLNDLRRRILDHDRKVALKEADPSQPPYTIEELKLAIEAISVNRENIAAAESKKERKSSGTKSIDLTDLI